MGLLDHYQTEKVEEIIKSRDEVIPNTKKIFLNVTPPILAEEIRDFFEGEFAIAGLKIILFVWNLDVPSQNFISI